MNDASWIREIGLQEEIELEVVNWEEHNPKAFEARHPWWFRVHSKLYRSPNMHALTPQARWCFMAVLCVACERRTKYLKGTLNWFIWVCGVDEGTLRSCLETLDGKSFRVHKSKTVQSSAHIDKEKEKEEIYIPHSLQNEDLRDPKSPQMEKTLNRRKSKNRGYEEFKEPFDLLALYAKYPRKTGKEEGLKKAKRDVEDPPSYQQLSEAIDKYVAFCVAERRAGKFIKGFDSFMSSWRDWLDADAGTTNVIELTANRFEVKNAFPK